MLPTTREEMRSYKTYVVLIFLVYLTLIILFHTELQRNVKTPSSVLRILEVRDTSKTTKDVGVDSHGKQAQAEPSDLNSKSRPVFDGPKPDVKVTVTTTVRTKVLKARPQTLGLRRRKHSMNDTFKVPYKLECKQSHRKIKELMFQPLGQHYIYSAYYDDRKERPFIRMMTLFNRDRKQPLYCIFENSGTPSNEVFASNVIFYEMCENHGRPYGGWILSCEVPPEVKNYPCQIRVSSERKPDTGIIVPVLASNDLQKEPKKEFGICIPPLFGYIRPEVLIQFIEISLLLGAKHLNFYTFQVHKDIEKILEYYVDEGVVTRTIWKLPILPSNVWYNGQLITINDCLYRNMYHFKYIAFNDIDEFIVPHAFPDWHGLISHMEQESKNKNASGFSFPSAFFSIELRERRKQDLFFVIETQRTRIFSQVRTKVMVHPPNIFELGIHHISRPMPDHLQPFRVDPAKAFLHHYRKCVTDFDPRMRCNQVVPDAKLLTHEQTIKDRSDAVMQIVFGPATTMTPEPTKLKTRPRPTKRAHPTL